MRSGSNEGVAAIMETVEMAAEIFTIGMNPAWRLLLMGRQKIEGEQMKLRKFNLKSLSMDELWTLHEEVGAKLSERITAKKRELEEGLAKLNSSLISDKAIIKRAASQGSERRARRKYPPVLPKYRNPSDPSETWAGRGKQPRWLVSQLKAGKKMNDFLINRTKQRPAKRRPA